MINWKFWKRNNGIPMPPKKYITAIGSGDFKDIGQHFLKNFIKFCSLKPHHKVLDIGCGVGRMAIPLTKYLKTGSYEGFDIVKKEIDWCQDNITARYSNFNFRFTDVYNKHYNPAGKINASEFKFPYRNESFDFVFLTSVFTHMLPEDMENYFSEISRVMKKDGKCLITYFLKNDESKRLLAQGKSTIDFKFHHENYSTQYLDLPEAAVLYDEKTILNIYKRYNLEVIKPIHYGNWCGRKKFLSYQDIIIAKKFTLL